MEIQNGDEEIAEHTPVLYLFVRLSSLPFAYFGAYNTVFYQRLFLLLFNNFRFNLIEGFLPLLGLRVFLLIPRGDCASIFISRLICAPSQFRWMKTQRIRSESLSHGTWPLSVSFVTVSLPRTVVAIGIWGGSFASTPLGDGFSTSSFTFLAISLLTIWFSSVNSRRLQIRLSVSCR
jgi:hypothetical protein